MHACSFFELTESFKVLGSLNLLKGHIPLSLLLIKQQERNGWPLIYQHFCSILFFRGSYKIFKVPTT
jgi:hypothetical protein